jgi:hypothetical protein
MQVPVAWALEVREARAESGPGAPAEWRQAAA